jgi:hypothetical protein
MTARHNLLRDAGVLPLACALALAAAGGASAAKPNPHNFPKPGHGPLGLSHNFIHTMPHNFAKINPNAT